LKPKDFLLNEKLDDFMPKDCRKCRHYSAHGWCDFRNKEIRRPREEADIICYTPKGKSLSRV
jgi:hypothetical protein